MVGPQKFALVPIQGKWTRHFVHCDPLLLCARMCVCTSQFLADRIGLALGPTLGKAGCGAVMEPGLAWVEPALFAGGGGTGCGVNYVPPSPRTYPPDS